MSKQKKTIRKLKIIIAVLLLALVGSMASRCSKAERAYPKDETPKLQEIWSYGSGDIKVVRIPLEGVIMHDSNEGLFSTRMDMVKNVLSQIRTAENDPDIRAIILEVNSPGGGVTPSDEIYHALLGFRKSRPDRKIIAFIRDLGASGAYYASMASDWIIAEPTAAVGSIGVIMQSLNLQGLSQKIGITDVTIKSGENKDLLNPFQPVNTNQVELLQELVDTMQDRFSGIVSEARKLDREALPHLFDGRIFSANSALENGLIDEIGYWNDALSRTAALLDTGALHVIRYEPHRTALESLLQGKNPIALPQLKQNAPKLLYIWKP